VRRQLFLLLSSLPFLLLLSLLLLYVRSTALLTAAFLYGFFNYSSPCRFRTTALLTAFLAPAFLYGFLLQLFLVQLFLQIF
jgi:hypothetical protein